MISQQKSSNIEQRNTEQKFPFFAKEEKLTILELDFNFCLTVLMVEQVSSYREDIRHEWVKQQVLAVYKATHTDLNELKTAIQEKKFSHTVSHQEVYKVLSAFQKRFENKEAMQNSAGLVLSVQIALTQLGYHPGTLDGIWKSKNKTTSQTKQAIEKFQADHHLKVDGIVGPVTLKVLLQVLDTKFASSQQEVGEII